MNPTHSPSIALATLCCRILDDKKAMDLRALDVSAISSITNTLVIATATSEPHLRALRVELEKGIDTSGTRIVGMETTGESGWIVVDLFDVMVHLFTAERRALYNLERLWKDAREIPVARLLAPEPAPVPAAAPARKGAAVRKRAPVSKAKTKEKAKAKTEAAAEAGTARKASVPLKRLPARKTAAGRKSALPAAGKAVPKSGVRKSGGA